MISLFLIAGLLQAVHADAPSAVEGVYSGQMVMEANSHSYPCTLVLAHPARPVDEKHLPGGASPLVGTLTFHQLDPNAPEATVEQREERIRVTNDLLTPMDGVPVQKFDPRYSWIEPKSQSVQLLYFYTDVIGLYELIGKVEGDHIRGTWDDGIFPAVAHFDFVRIQ